ncbi:MAG TPA: hypothetical protein VGH33_18465 [Isosphaeraceae bacterium]
MTRAANDDLYERPPGPRPSEIRAGWAREGDVENLWNVLVSTPWDRIDREAVFTQLLQALGVRSRSDPEEFARASYSRMTVFTSALLMRCQLYLATYVEQSGRALRMRGQPPGDLPEAAVARLIPKMLEIQEHLSVLLSAEAAVARQWSLVARNKGRRDPAPDAGPRRTRDGVGPTPTSEQRPPARANGSLAGRLAGVTDGHGSPNGGARDD